MQRFMHFLNDHLLFHCHCAMGEADEFLPQLAHRLSLWGPYRDRSFASRLIKRDMPFLPAEAPDARSLFANPSLN